MQGDEVFGCRSNPCRFHSGRRAAFRPFWSEAELIAKEIAFRPAAATFLLIEFLEYGLH